MFRSGLIRLRPTTALRPPPRLVAPLSRASKRQQSTQQQQTRQAHAISGPTLANIEKRWEGLPPQEQADLWQQLRVRMRVDWNELTLQEKKAAYWIAFGPHGPRALAPPGETTKIFWYTVLGLAVSTVVFVLTKYFARPPPRTMNKEWQEATNEFFKENNIEPITGVSSENYKGPGMVQSAPKDK